ncbi:MAG: hypothetical protein EHM36_04185 [Deltaproteobacteria bacterium]|nr:MAG: hypothetical protein EHM36_04185 [Deltaproteobacteria bacterium]
MGLFQQASRKRITLSLNTDVPGDREIFDFLTGLPKRTRSEIIKEILLDALEKRDQNPKPDSLPTTKTGDAAGTDPDEIIEKLF